MKNILAIIAILVISTYSLGITCPSGQKVVSSGFVATQNGCGGSDVQRAVSDLLNPFDDKFDGCCRKHDTCFG